MIVWCRNSLLPSPYCYNQRRLHYFQVGTLHDVGCSLGIIFVSNDDKFNNFMTLRFQLVLFVVVYNISLRIKFLIFVILILRQNFGTVIGLNLTIWPTPIFVILLLVIVLYKQRLLFIYKNTIYINLYWKKQLTSSKYIKLISWTYNINL